MSCEKLIVSLLKLENKVNWANCVNVVVVEFSAPVRWSNYVCDVLTLGFPSLLFSRAYAHQNLKKETAFLTRGVCCIQTEVWRQSLVADTLRVVNYRFRCNILCVVAASLSKCLGLITTDLCWSLMTIEEAGKAMFRRYYKMTGASGTAPQGQMKLTSVLSVSCWKQSRTVVANKAHRNLLVIIFSQLQRLNQVLTIAGNSLKVKESRNQFKWLWNFEFFQKKTELSWMFLFNLKNFLLLVQLVIFSKSSSFLVTNFAVPSQEKRGRSQSY